MKELADGTPQKRYVRSTIFYVSLQEWERSQQKIKVRENLKYFDTPIFRRVVVNLKQFDQFAFKPEATNSSKC